MRLLSILLATLVAVTSAFADEIVLKSGEKIKGVVIEKNSSYIKIDINGAVIAYRTFEIESVDGKSAGSVKDTYSDKTLDLLMTSSAPSGSRAGADVVTAEEYLRRGVAFYSTGNFDQAMADINRAIKNRLNYVEAYFYRGLAYMGKNDPDKAISDYNKVIELNPKSAEPYYVRGLAYAAKGNSEQALSDYNKAIEINPDYIQAYLSRTAISTSKGDRAQVIADVNKVISINPKVSAAYYIRAVMYANENNIEQAIPDYDKAIELNPNYIEAYINRALAYTYKDIARVTWLDPNSSAGLINVGIPNVNRENLDKAIADCNKVIMLAPKYSDIYAIRARIYFIGKDFDNAWADVHKAEALGVKIKPEFVEDLKKSSGREK